MNYKPDDSGIPNIRGKVAIVKALASSLSIGSGAAVGREGPIIQIGSALGSASAQVIRLSNWQKITLLSAGAGAGIAATFNTPLGGVLSKEDYEQHVGHPAARATSVLGRG
ncbi:chloride channel protein [Nitrobacter sp. NHB1]|uniref:chloride channel protein n=1 Tax=Nitrobacter sp. NHB1 TaxID=3119830 RepID=UPI002FFE9BCA